MASLSRWGLLCAFALVGCSNGTGEWDGRFTEEDGVVRVQNPSTPLAGPGEIQAELLWTSSGPGEGDFWEVPNGVRANDEAVFVVDRQAAKIHRLSPDGTILPSLGEPGEGPGQYNWIVDAIPTDAGLFVIDGGNGRVDILGLSGEVLASSPLGQWVFSAVPLGEDAVGISGFLEEEKWQRIDAAGNLRDMSFPEFIDPDTSEALAARPGLWDGNWARLRFTAPQIQVFSPDGSLQEVIEIPLPVEEATDQEIDDLIAEMAEVLAGDGLSGQVIQRQAERLRSRPRAKPRFRDFRFGDSSSLAAIWEQNPEDYGSGNATLHLLSSHGVYLGLFEFDRAWSSFDLRHGVVYALARDPGTDLVTLAAYSISVPGRVLERAEKLATAR